MKSIGFPRMHKEANEKRDFLPDFFNQLDTCNTEIFLEEGYGKDIGISADEYLKQNPNIKFTSNRECYEKDIIVVLRCPEIHELNYMKDGSTLVSMLHYPTRKSRVEYLKNRNIFGVSLDLIRNDLMDRMIVDYKGTAGNGIEIAFSQLYKEMSNHKAFKQRPVQVGIIGMGMVGLMAAKASGKFGSRNCAEQFSSRDMNSVMVNMLPRNLTCSGRKMEGILKNIDILVDASNRSNPSEYIIKNEALRHMKDYAVILDLSADPYLSDVYPAQVKAIEGIPTGTLDKYIFGRDDEEYRYVPVGVSNVNRRAVVSCNAWPGIRPYECMKLYGIQMKPVMKRLIANNREDFCIDSDDFFIRAIYRSTIDYYEGYETELNVEIS